MINRGEKNGKRVNIVLRNVDILSEEILKYGHCNEWNLAGVAICRTYSHFLKTMLRFG